MRDAGRRLVAACDVVFASALREPRVLGIVFVRTHPPTPVSDEYICPLFRTIYIELLVPLYVGCLDRQVCGMLIGSHLGAGRHGRLTHYPFAINFSHRCPR